MKNLILSLIIFTGVSVAEAQSQIRPQIREVFDQLRVETWNYTDKTISCSGWINVTYQNHDYESQYYSETISPNRTSYQTIYLRSHQRILFVRDSIYCREF